MKLNFQSEQRDHVAFHEYHSEHSPVFISVCRKHRIMVPIIYSVFGVLGLFNESTIMASIFFGLAILWYYISPSRLRKKNRKLFIKHVAETAGGSFSEPTILEILEDGVQSTSFMGVSTFKYSSLGEISETADYTFMYIGKAMALICPHDRIPKDDLETFVSEVKKRKEAVTT